MDEIHRARRGLLVFFGILVPLSGLVEALIVRRVYFIGRGGLVFALMWIPAVASCVARLVVREGFGDLSLRLGGARGLRAVLLAAAFPVVVGAIAYGLAWTTGLAEFAPPGEDMLLTIPLWIFPLSGSPAVRFAKLLATHLTVGSLIGAVWVAGEEIGWRGYLLQRLLDAKIPGAVLVHGLVWALWHWPLALSLAGDRRLVTVLLFTLTVVPIGCAMARQRLETGSLSPAIVLHAVWNDVISLVFGASTPKEGLWLGESGILVVVAVLMLLVPFLRGRWAARRTPGSPPYAEFDVFW